MVSVKEVRSAAVRAMEAGEQGVEYKIASDNLTCREWLTRLMTYTGKQKPVWTVPD